MRLQSPTGSHTRPTTGRVRGAVMNLLSGRLQGCHWLDLCSGSGVMGCEALRRGASLVVAVERDQRTARICAANLKATSKGLSHPHEIRIFPKELLSWLKRGRQNHGLCVGLSSELASEEATGLSCSKSKQDLSEEPLSEENVSEEASADEKTGAAQAGFDLVYLDPPYNSDLYRPALSALLQGDWLNRDALVICELDASNMFSAPDPWQEQDQRIYGNTAIRLISLR